MDVSSNCEINARRRRDVSSAVVDNTIERAEPINNFLTMMSEILGDEDMYVDARIPTF